jgi:GT2 family glycosyltransferase
MQKGLREVDLLHGKSTLFPVSVFESTGLFDEENFPHLFADDDLVLRAKHNGYRLLVDLDTVVLNDLTATGLNPYDRRPGISDIIGLFTSRKSAFQITTRTRFLWRHRRSAVSFVITWCADYLRLMCIIMLRWLVTDRMYRKIEQYYLRLVTIL